MTKKFVLLIVLLLVAVFILAGCEEEPTEVETKESFPSIESSRPSPPQTISPRIEVYLDGSGSMRGFISDENNRTGRTIYCDFLRDLEAYLKGRDAVYYKFGTVTQQIEDDLNTARTNLSFYDQTETRLAQLIERFLERGSQDLPRYFLIVTDGIHTAGGPDSADFLEMVSVISDWLSEGFYFDILALKSEFYGYVWWGDWEDKRRWYSSNEHGEERPFYLYVLSSIEGSGKQILDGLNALGFFEDISFENYLYLGSKLFDFARTKVEFNVLSKTSQRERNPLRKEAVRPNIQYLSWKNKDPYSSGEVRVTIPLTFKEGTEDLVPTEESIECEVEAREFVRLEEQRWEVISLPNPSLDVSLEVERRRRGIFTREEESFLICDFELENLESEGWIVYRIIPNFGSGAIRPPEWVEEVSIARRNLEVADFNKTPYFRRFIISILPAAFRKQPLAVFYFAVKGR